MSPAVAPTRSAQATDTWPVRPAELQPKGRALRLEDLLVHEGHTAVSRARAQLARVGDAVGRMLVSKNLVQQT